MQKFIWPQIVKFLAFSIFFAFLSAVIIFYFYSMVNNVREDAAGVLINENISSVERQENDNEIYSLCSYPENSLCSRISLAKNEACLGNRSLVLYFKSSNLRCFAGIHLNMTLVLESYLEDGIFEFWIKVKNKFPSNLKLNVWLREGTAGVRMAKAFLLIPSGVENWQKVYLPLSKFIPDLKVDRDNKFTWEIGEILFSVDNLRLKDSIELFIGGLKILRDNEVIYDLPCNY